MSDKVRLDVLLVEQGLYESREKAKSAIMAGLVYVDGEKMDKAGTKIPRNANLQVKGSEHPYVGRGGLKLKKAIDYFQIDFTDKVVLDIGASTGGFTDCALQHGARYVYAIDVGYNQLAWSLRQDQRVCVMERTNFRYVTEDQLKGPKPNMAVIDVSFISLDKILPPLKPLLLPSAGIVALIKPQFEAGRDKVGKSGVVRDPKVHKEVLQRILQFADECGYVFRGLTYSPIRGSEGNIEFLAYWTHDTESPGGDGAVHLERQIEQVVFEAAAHFAR